VLKIQSVSHLFELGQKVLQVSNTFVNLHHQERLLEPLGPGLLPSAL